MTWLLWRQHRVRVLLALALLAAFAVPTVLTDSHLVDALNRCRATHTCGGLDILQGQGYSVMRALVNLTIAVPLFIGAFWGATIVGRELESGTAALVWTQSVSRRHWIGAKTSSLFVFTALCSGAVAALSTWWSNPANATMQSRFDGFEFDVQGVVPVAFALFAAALGLAAGVFWRRTVPAMATTVCGFVGVRLVVELLVRPNYIAPVTHFARLSSGWQVPSGSLVNSTDLMMRGQLIAGKADLATACPGTLSRPAMNQCFDQLGYRVRTVYQPPSRYWPFQWIEFGIFAGLAVLLTAVALVMLRRRDV